MTFTDNGKNLGRRRCVVRRMTLVEVSIATTLSVAIMAAIMLCVLMARARLKSGQSQIRFQSRARYGAEHITRAIQRAKIVSSENGGTGVYIINPNDTVERFYYEDADDDESTILDNAIWHDPELDASGDETVVLSCVTPLGDSRMFQNSGSGVALRFHVGDPASVSLADHITGTGYQGVQVRVFAKPRNIGHIWTSRDFDSW